jgi:formate hydrogenlyase subunit 6/NADH:ubiquinone oxidoreductase subunit I
MAKESFLNLFKKPACLMYPLEPRQYPAGARGHIANAIESCVFCGICQKKCPTGAITVERKTQTWRLETLRCIACGSCSEACPKKCLTLHSGYSAPLTVDERHTAIHVLRAAQVDADAAA